MKRMISCLLILMLLAVSMTGCGGTQKTEDKKAAGTEQSEKAGTDKMGAKLSAAYVDMMKNGNYLMKYKANMEVEGQTTTVEATIAVSGEKTAVSSTTEGYQSKAITMDDKLYMVDDNSKTVIVMKAQPTETSEGINTEGITYVGSGTEDGLAYEEYSTSDSTIKYYFDGKDLVKIKLISEDAVVTEMEIIEMSNDVPESMFEIPADYQVTNM